MREKERETRRVKVSLFLCRDECASFVRGPEDKSTRCDFLHRLVFRKEKTNKFDAVCREIETRSLEMFRDRRCHHRKRRRCPDIFLPKHQRLLKTSYLESWECVLKIAWHFGLFNFLIIISILFHYRTKRGSANLSSFLTMDDWSLILAGLVRFFFIQLNACDTFIFFFFFTERLVLPR